MVTVVDFESVTKEDGKEFMLLILQGGVELIKSEATGRMYFTARTVKVPATFNEITCKSLIGSQFSGAIVKVTSEPYKYTIKESGEVIELTHRYEYVTDTASLLENQVVDSESVY
ncbi:MAG TPA: hypothetical protein VF677_16650 [Flavobacterium sp.]|jgi:hypothetical protein